MKKTLIITALVAVSALSAMDNPEGPSSSTKDQKKASAKQRRFTRLANRTANRGGSKRIGQKILKMNADRGSATAAAFLSRKAKKPSDKMKFALQALENAYTQDKTTEVTMGDIFTTLQMDSEFFLDPRERILLRMIQEAQERYAETNSDALFSVFDTLRNGFFNAKATYQFGWNWQKEIVRPENAIIVGQMLAKQKISADFVVVKALMESISGSSKVNEQKAKTLLSDIFSEKLSFDINTVKEDATVYDIACEQNLFGIAELIRNLGGRAYGEIVSEQQKAHFAQLKAKRTRAQKKNKQ